MNSILHKFLISRKFRAINSVGLECYLDRVDVTGSSPVWPTQLKIFVLNNPIDKTDLIIRC